MIHAHKGGADAANEDLCATIKQSEQQRAQRPLCICISLHQPPSASISLHQPPSASGVIKACRSQNSLSACVCVVLSHLETFHLMFVQSNQWRTFCLFQNTFLSVLPGRFLIILHCSDRWLINGPVDVPVPASDVKVKSISDCWSKKRDLMQASR